MPLYIFLYFAPINLKNPSTDVIFEGFFFHTDGYAYLACPPKVEPRVKIVVVEKERNRAYDT